MTHLVLAADEAEKHDTLNEASSPVPEPIIESSQKTTHANSFIIGDTGINLPASSVELTALNINTDSESTVVDTVKPSLLTVDPVKPATLTVDTIKIKDFGNLELETSTSLKPTTDSPEQPSPNDSGIHSETTPSESSDVDELGSQGSDNSLVSPQLRQVHSSGDLTSAVTSLPVVDESTESTETSSLQTTPR